jgi:hypothetical protein
MLDALISPIALLFSTLVIPAFIFIPFLLTLGLISSFSHNFLGWMAAEVIDFRPFFSNMNFS